MSGLCCHDIQCTPLECLYSPSHWSSVKPPHLVIDRFIVDMRQCYQKNLENIPVKKAVLYGECKEKIDIWGDELKSNAAMVLFHGGYWQEGDRELFTSPVKILVENDFVVGCVGYDYATTVPLSKLIEQAMKALKFLEKRWPNKKLIAGGHSAGAHLVLAALKRLKYSHHYQKAVLFSGIYDIIPLVDTYIGNPINLTVEEAEACSITNLDNLTVKLLTIVGAEESPKFKEQNQRIMEKYVDKRNDIELSDCYKVIPGEDHFSIISNLADRNSIVSKEFLNFII